MMSDQYTSKRNFFESGKTRKYEFRIEQLKKLKNSIKEYEDDIIKAMKIDLGKPTFEAFTSEIGILYEELNIAIKNLSSWMKKKSVSTPIFLFPSKSYILPEPKGVVFIISPWNYPFQLAISPLIGAIAAGNCALVKPSNQSKATEEIIFKLISETFDDNYISVLRGPGSKVVEPLIDNYNFDHIFFTGSVGVGKKILKHSAKHLTPTTLELGGKSPSIVFKDADLEEAAKKITWAKYYNLGQTCVAPDYLLVHEDVKEELIEKIKKYIVFYHGEDPVKSENLGKLINEKRFDRLLEIMKGDIIYGGKSIREKLFIYPTIIDNVGLDDPIMSEEIFGPILPIISFKDKEEIISIVRKNKYPLALYLFTEDRAIEDYILQNIQFGGGCINDAISHLVNPKLPFGGIGTSGKGQYHAKYSFDTFSHMKSIFKSGKIFQTNLKYPPYTDLKLKLARFFMK